MARKSSRKHAQRVESSSESSSQSESSESESSSSDSEQERQQQRRGTQKRQTQVRKNTQRKPTQNIKSLVHINGKLNNRSQEELQEEDDYNMNPTRNGVRKPTQVVRGSDSTAADFKRTGQRGMTKIQAQNLISNLENELVVEKNRQEQLQKENEELNQIAQHEMINLHQQKLKLIKRADQKKSHIESIAKKLDEQKQNNVDIMQSKSIKPHQRESCWQIVINIVHFFFDNYLLSSYSYRMANSFDNKVYEHFAFISYFYNCSVLGFVCLIYLLIEQILSNHANFSVPSLFFSYSFNGNIAAFVILCLLVVVLQIVIVFMKYDKYKCRRVKEIARYNSKLNLFRLLVSEYNWKIQSRTQLEKIQLAFYQRATFLLNSKNTGNKLQRNEIDYAQLCFRFLGFVLSVGIIAGQIVGIQYFFKDGKVNAGDFYLSTFIESLVCSAICIIGSSITSVFHSFEQLNSLFYKQMRYYALQIIPCCYYLLSKTLILFENKYSIPSYIHVDSFAYDQFSCANQQLGYQLIIFMLTYAFFAIFYTYLQIFYHYLSKKCSRNGNNSHTSLSLKYFYYVRFRSCQQTIPFMVVFFLMLCIIPLNPYVVIINFFVFGFVFLHNYLQAKRFFLPQLDNFSSIMIKGMIIKMLAFTIFLGTIYQIIIFALDYDLGYYIKDNNLATCGPFNKGQSGITEIWEGLGSFSDFLLVITWKPILLFLLIFFILNAITGSNQINEWQRQYQDKDQELRALKKFYSKEVTNLEDKINYAQKNIVDMVEEDIKEIQIEQTNKKVHLQNSYLSPQADNTNKQMFQSPSGNNMPSVSALGNGSMISTFVQNNKENDVLIQNLNIQPNNYHTRNPSLNFNTPLKNQFLTTNATINSVNSNKQLLDQPYKNNSGINSPSPVLITNGAKSLFNIKKV